MKLPADMAATALRELRTIASIVDDMEVQDFRRPTALPGWTVEDLVRHVTAVAARQAEAFHRARFTINEAPTNAIVTAPLERLPATLQSVLVHSTSGVVGLDMTDDPTVPLPYASLPASLAAYVLLVEYGIHRYDIEHATQGSAVLADDVANSMADLVGLTLPSLASPGEPPIHSIRFEAYGRPPTTLAWRSGGWTTSNDGSPASCVVRGPADALALFVVGRIAIPDDRLTVEDPTGALTHFKSMFPGP